MSEPTSLDNINNDIWFRRQSQTILNNQKILSFVMSRQKKATQPTLSAACNIII